MTAALILADPVALRSVTTRVVTAVVPVLALGVTGVLVWLRLLPGWPWRKRKLREAADEDRVLHLVLGTVDRHVPRP